MMKRIFKGIGIFLGAIVLLFLGFYVKAHFSTEERINAIYDVTPQKLDIQADSATMALGKRLITARGCDECHGPDLGGKVFIDNPALGRIVASNITKGDGGLPPDYSVRDWVLALKHGLNQDMKPLLFMPSHEFSQFSERDLKAIIAYASRVPEVDRELPENDLGFMAEILTELGEIPLIPAEMIDHNKMLAKDIKVEVSAEYGKYLSVSCGSCHRENMKGGEPIAPGFPPVPDITAAGNVGHWTERQFISTLRTGKTPEGKILKPAEMPWTMTKAYTDVELKALFAYLTSI